MHATSLLPLCLLAKAALAHSSSEYWGAWSSSSTSTSTVAAAQAASSNSASVDSNVLVQVVSVSDANSTLKYFPDTVQAPVGSIVQFQFHPKNHTVTESTFAEPCKPVAQSNASLITETRPGLKSGFIAVSANDTETPVYNVLINDTNPIWIYCGQVNHCEKGMAMVINQNLSSTDKTIAAYIAAAAKLPLTSTNTTTTTTTTTSSSGSTATASSASSEATSIATATATGSAASIVATSATSSASTATFTGGAAAGILQQGMERGGHFAVAGALLAGVAALL